MGHEILTRPLRWSGRFVALMLFFSSTLWASDHQMELPDPVACLKAIEPLDVRFRAHLQRDCLQIALNLCAAPAAPRQCLLHVRENTQDFVDHVRERLPAEIKGTRLQRLSYRRGLMRIDRVDVDQKSCIRRDITDPEICEMLDMSAKLIDAFLAARRAGIRLP